MTFVGVGASTIAFSFSEVACYPLWIMTEQSHHCQRTVRSSSNCFSSLDEGDAGDLNSLSKERDLGLNSGTYDMTL